MNPQQSSVSNVLDNMLLRFIHHRIPLCLCALLLSPVSHSQSIFLRHLAVVVIAFCFEKIIVKSKTS